MKINKAKKLLEIDIMKFLLLFSSGLDSSSVAYYYAKKGLDFDCLFINYGQSSARMQLKYGKIICEKLKRRLIIINAKNLGEAFVNNNWLRPHEPIIHRNLVIVPIAIAYAKQNGYKRVIMATIKEDCEYEPNRRDIMEKLKELGEILGVRFETPFVNFPKYLLLKIGIKSGLDPSLTYSCLLGHKYHCGKCSQCLKRIEAFKQAKIRDPTIYK
ncbi:7-cyano-7-deazaguanine synthase [Saccharolobus caldissimus]|uniref:7-cyano-7-deazaguanine synthase n=1 Tax=Saccharolobus caldissimus TaxID=1702097 RepID=A0AAQ4CQX5_9CREN|nr:7-cyano-7-deazaguanine synthase [Saccharolobus caldissimus]BDB98206.1 7-cyano-7-deazaguanine synthase [Saccharolobus caldissimus]